MKGTAWVVEVKVDGHWRVLSVWSRLRDAEFAASTRVSEARIARWYRYSHPAVRRGTP